jgi:branched-chain amino acid transport system substrate-binding protein
MYGCLDCYPFSREFSPDTTSSVRAAQSSPAAATGMYRGLKLWQAAVREAGSIKQEDVVGTLDHARIAQGPGAPAEIVAGQHHVRMNMYVAQVTSGKLNVVKSLGTHDPRECTQGVS